VTAAPLETVETLTRSATSLISIREAAELANVSKTHVWRLIQRGEIEGLRVGEGHGPIRIPRESFLQWLYGGSRRAGRPGEATSRPSRPVGTPEGAG
jgi:excisionase family DNA binding protein